MNTQISFAFIQIFLGSKKFLLRIQQNTVTDNMSSLIMLE